MNSSARASSCSGRAWSSGACGCRRGYNRSPMIAGAEAGHLHAQLMRATRQRRQRVAPDRRAALDHVDRRFAVRRAGRSPASGRTRAARHDPAAAHERELEIRQRRRERFVAFADPLLAKQRLISAAASKDCTTASRGPPSRDRCDAAARGADCRSARSTASATFRARERRRASPAGSAVCRRSRDVRRRTTPLP